MGLLGQGLLFGLVQQGLKVSLGTVGGIDAIMVLTLKILKQGALWTPHCSSFFWLVMTVWLGFVARASQKKTTNGASGCC